MKNKLAAAFFVGFFVCLSVLADVPAGSVGGDANTVSAQKPEVVSVNFEDCVKTYNTSVDNLFYLTLASMGGNNYKIDEIQSRTGLISFTAGNKNMLASVTKIDEKTSMIKITPADNSYVFSPSIPERIFQYLTNNIK